MRGFGDFGGRIIADGGRKRCHQHQAFFHQLFDARNVGLGAHHHIIGERSRRVAQKLHGLQDVIGHHWVVNVQLKMPLRSGKAHGGIIAHDMGADHRQRFGLCGVHFAGHDRRSGFVFGQNQLAQARTWARPQKPQVIGDFEQACCHGFQRA